MRQTASGRWVPGKPQKSSPVGECTELASLQAACRAAIAAGVQMPDWWPVMYFWAAVGRDTLRAT